MKFRSIEIENFLSISSGKVGLADRGLVAIQGQNEDDTSADSNGAGKSSLADALCWVLYGATARGVTGDAVVNDKAGKGTRVAVILDDGPTRYLVERHRKHKTGKNGLKLSTIAPTLALNVTADLTLGTDKLTQERLEKILGCSYEVFRAAVYAGQEQMPDLPAMTDKELKLLVEEASGITILEAAYEEARKRLVAKQTQVGEKLHAVGVVDVRINANSEAAADAKKRAEDFEELRKDRVLGRKREAKTLAKMAHEVALRIAARPFDESGLRDKIAELDRKIASVAEQQKRERELQSELTAAERHLATREYEHSAAKKNLDEAIVALRDLDGKIGCPCSECQQPLTAEAIAPAREAAERRVNSRRKDEEHHREYLRIERVIVRDARAALEAHRKSMTDVTATASLRSDLLAELASVQHDVREHARLLGEIRVQVEEAKRIQAEGNPHIAVVEAAIRKDDALKLEKTAVEKQVAELRAEEEILKAVVKVFGPAGVRAHILDDVTPFLNAQTAHYLATLSDGQITAVWSTLSRTAKGELREKFAIEVSHAIGGKSFAALSGGEKRKVRVACALALQDLVARRASKPIDLFVGDEIDDALDPAGLERLMTILEEKARERGSVFVISHHDLADWVPNRITITKKGGVSVVEEETA